MIALLVVLATVAHPGAARIGPSSYRSPFPVQPNERAVPVAAFWLDREPVTNREFLAFVEAHPEWRRDRVRPLYVDPGYLSHWAAADSLGAKAPPRAPVVRVSWYAARAYCTARGGRLPSEAEWELAAAASGTRDDLAWYEAPMPDVLGDIGGPPNAAGISDLHALVWEWVDDFGASFVAPDASRACGAGGGGAVDPRAYATYMRFALRSSLQARDTIPSLGFRCAYDGGMP